MNFLGDNRWLVFILPGFIALFVASFISDFPEVRESQLPIIYIALTALSVSIPLAVVHAYGVIFKVPYTWNDIIRSPYVLLGILASSIVLGFLFGVAHTTDYVSRGLRGIFGRDIVLTSSHSDPLHQVLKNSYNENFWPPVYPNGGNKPICPVQFLGEAECVRGSYHFVFGIDGSTTSLSFASVSNRGPERNPNQGSRCVGEPREGRGYSVY
ncbi:hypothetical protein [Rhizobium herbae]